MRRYPTGETSAAPLKPEQPQARFAATSGFGTAAVRRWSVRSAKLWTSEEEDLLRRRAAEGASLEAVAAELGRTVVAVSGRATRLRVTLRTGRGLRTPHRRDRTDDAVST